MLTTSPGSAITPAAVRSDPLTSPPRRFFSAVLLGGGSAGLGGFRTIAVVRSLVRPLLVNTTEKSRSEVGKVDEFRSITVPVEKWVQFEQRDRWRRLMSENPAYVVKDAAAN